MRSFYCFQLFTECFAHATISGVNTVPGLKSCYLCGQIAALLCAEALRNINVSVCVLRRATRQIIAQILAVF
jgi:hypothetical protein